MDKLLKTHLEKGRRIDGTKLQVQVLLGWTLKTDGETRDYTAFRAARDARRAACDVRVLE